MKSRNIRIIGVPEEGEREQGIETLFEEIMIGNFPNQAKELDIQGQEPERMPNKRNSNLHQGTS